MQILSVKLMILYDKVFSKSNNMLDKISYGFNGKYFMRFLPTHQLC